MLIVMLIVIWCLTLKEAGKKRCLLALNGLKGFRKGLKQGLDGLRGGSEGPVSEGRGPQRRSKGGEG